MRGCNCAKFLFLLIFLLSSYYRRHSAYRILCKHPCRKAINIHTIVLNFRVKIGNFTSVNKIVCKKNAVCAFTFHVGASTKPPMYFPSTPHYSVIKWSVYSTKETTTLNNKLSTQHHSTLLFLNYDSDILS